MSRAEPPVRAPPDPALIPVLVELQANLDQDLSLKAMARDFGYSPFHFHRLFSAAVGETPKKHVERLRLERAAYLLAACRESVLDIGLAVGFQSHESFSRAFRRWFGYSPSGYRRAARAAQRERMERRRGFRGEGCRLSDVRFERVRATPLLAIRRMGAYAEFGPDSRARLWDELESWAAANGVAHRPVRLGLFPDDPGVTPRAQQRADLCIPLERPTAGTDRLRCIELAGGVYGVIEHAGPYETIGQAYQTAADGIRRSAFVFRDGPPVQVFREVAIGGDPDANRSEVWFPVQRPG